MIYDRILYNDNSNLCKMTKENLHFKCEKKINHKYVIVPLQAITSDRSERWMLVESLPAVGFSMKECNTPEQEEAPNPTST